MSRRLRVAAATLVAGVALVPTLLCPTAAEAVTPTAGVDSRRVDRVAAPPPTWTACEHGQCASIDVPLDYDDPGGPTVSVALSRIPARKPSERIGALVLNPGGPGVWGTAFPQRATTWLGAEVLDRFDLIGFDPRGTYESTQTRCFPTAAKAERVTQPLLAMGFPVTPREESTWIQSSTKVARACSGYGQDLAAAMSTAQVARDLDVIRRALGESSLNYLGFSYGSYLGQVYANMFPDRFRALAIDGVIDPRAWVGTRATADVPMSVRMGSAPASSAALTETFRLCTDAPDVCGVSDPAGTFARVAERLRTDPLTMVDETGAEDVLTYQKFVATALYSLYSESGPEVIPMLAEIVEQLQVQGLPAFQHQRLASTYGKTAERARRQAEQSGYLNLVEQVPAVMCSDSRNPRKPSAWTAMADRQDALAPYFGRHWLWGSAYCADRSWNATDEDAWQGPFDTPTAAPVLVVGNHHDPATSYSAAVAVSELLPNSRLLSSTNWGHTAYGVSACATRHVDRYLVSGVLPPEGTLCTDGHQPFQR